MKNWNKFCIAMAGSLSILATTVLAVTGTVNAPNGLVFRTEPSGNPITTVPDKAEVNIIDENGEWYKATYNNQEGYLFKQYVNVSETIPEKEEEPNNSDKQIQTKTKLKVYIIPSVTSTVISEIEPNANITIQKEITNWSYISSGDVQGWIRTYGIKGEVKEEKTIEEPEKTETPEEERKTEPVEQEETEQEEVAPQDNKQSEEKTSSVTKGFVNVDYAIVRGEPSTSASIITTLTMNTSFTINAETEDWYKITYTGIDGTVYKGYIFKKLVKPANN